MPIEISKNLQDNLDILNLKELNSLLRLSPTQENKNIPSEDKKPIESEQFNTDQLRDVVRYMDIEDLEKLIALPSIYNANSDEYQVKNGWYSDNIEEADKDTRDTPKKIMDASKTLIYWAGSIGLLQLAKSIIQERPKHKAGEPTKKFLSPRNLTVGNLILLAANQGHEGIQIYNGEKANGFIRKPLTDIDPRLGFIIDTFGFGATLYGLSKYKRNPEKFVYPNTKKVRNITTMSPLGIGSEATITGNSIYDTWKTWEELEKEKEDQRNDRQHNTDN